MSPTAQSTHRSTAAIAAVTAGGVAAVILVQELLHLVIGWLSSLPYMLDGGYGLGYFGGYGPSYVDVLSRLMTVAVPVGVGFFLSLWLLAPITGGQRLLGVIARGAIATAAGTAVMLVLNVLLGVLSAFVTRGSLFGNSFPFPDFNEGNAFYGISSAFSGAFATLVGTLPLGVLAAVLLWLWLRERAAKHPGATTAAEV